jgi:SAM-dependent methyltransferase
MSDFRVRRLANYAVRYLGAGCERINFIQLGFLRRIRPTRTGRSVLAQKYLRGSGIELGAMASPTFCPLGATIKYVDHVPRSHWLSDENYEEYCDQLIVDPHIIDDAQTLSEIEDDQFDFLIAFHVLEHLPRTLHALENWTRVVRSGGHILMAVPDMRFTNDRTRDITPFEHFLRDYNEGPEWSEKEHYRDIALNVLKLTSEEEIDEYARRTPSPHFHVWDLSSFIKFIVSANEILGAGFELLEVGLNSSEDICVLRVN